MVRESFWQTSSSPDGRNTWTRRPTCGILVIGDEILNGSTIDTNSHYLCAKLHKRGVGVKKIAVIGDNVNEIASEIRLFSGLYDVVLTTGGIGPTHDDRTFEGLGMAFDEELEINKELFQVVEVFLKKTKLADVDSAVEKFCKIPKAAQLLWGEEAAPQTPEQMTIFPSVQLKNVICFPGVPKFCRLAYDQLENTLFPRDRARNFYNETLYLKRNEVYLQENLTKIAETFKNRPNVTIGSYPIMDNNYFKTKLVVEAADPAEGMEAMEKLKSEFKGQEGVWNYF
uniref:MoCF_biosynth domain-containing protein n=1 Tax=Bursaphelenchus xylophilus TaxID=6326 RepID=A0A1I7SRY3_BURXY